MPNCYLCRIVAAVQWIQIIGLKFNIWQSHLFISIIIFICSWSEREKKCSLKLVSIWNVHSGTRASMHCHTGREKWGYCASKVLIYHKSLFAFPSLDWICGNKDLMSASLLLKSTFFLSLLFIFDDESCLLLRIAVIVIVIGTIQSHWFW